MPTLRNRRSSQGILESTGTPYSSALLVELLHAAEQHGAAVRDGDGGRTVVVLV